MVRNLNVQYVRRGMLVFGPVGMPSVLCLLAVYVYRHYIFQCIDGCGPYHNTTSVVDLDGYGDLDVVLSNLSKAEMVKIAESLVPMQTSEGEEPSPPN